MISIRFVAMVVLSATIFIVASVSATQLYRFTDENGVPTLSKTLPPEVAQQGYDILDEKSMRLIEQIPPAPTDAEILERQTQKVLQLEAQQQADLQEKIEIKKHRQQTIYDHNLLSAYQSEQDLVNKRDRDLQYREKRIEVLVNKRKGVQQRLQKAQQQAADRELSGMGLSDNLKGRLQAAQQELDNNQSSIEMLRTEIDTLSQKYEHELPRLRKLLGTTSAN